MASIDSAAVFRSRALSFGLLPADVDSLATHGWSTMASFAFSTSSIPGQSADDVVFRRDVVERVLGDPAHVRASLLRRLHFEAYTLTASDLRGRVERTGEDAPRRMPREERNSRLQALRRRLPGLDLTELNIPSHHMVDVFSQMQEEGQLRHLPWQEYASRQDEAKGVKRVKEWKPTASGNLQEVITTAATLVTVNGDNLRLMQAFTRRGVAMEIANLLTFDKHEVIVKFYMREMTRDPPPRYNSITYDQVLRTDIELFRIFADLTVEGLQMAADGSRPLDSLVAEALSDSTVRMLMLPLAHSSGAKDPKKENPEHKGPRPPDPSSKKSLKKARQAAARAAAGGAPPPAPPGGKSTGKGAGPRQPVSLPDGLAGTTVMPDGASICFGYQFGKCPLQAQKKCKRGVHNCTQCYGEHPFTKCPG